MFFSDHFGNVFRVWLQSKDVIVEDSEDVHTVVVDGNPVTLFELRGGMSISLNSTESPKAPG